MDVRVSVAHAAQRIRELTKEAGGEVTHEGCADTDKIEGHQMQVAQRLSARHPGQLEGGSAVEEISIWMPPGPSNHSKSDPGGLGLMRYGG